MSDAMVPSYRLHRPQPAVPWRMIAVAGGIMALVGAGAAGWWAIQRVGSRGVPVVEADPRPFKVRPDDPGGLRVPNQTELVLERPGNRQQVAAQGGRQAALMPQAEAPNIDLLRAAVAPPPPVVAAAPAPAAANLAAPPAPPAEAAAPAPAVTDLALPPPPPPPLPAPMQQAAAPPPSALAPPRASAPPAAPAPTRVAVGGRFVVQLAALTSEEGARTEWDRVSRRAPDLLQGRSPIVMRVDREGQSPIYRLRTGGFADQDSAREFCEQVRAKGATCIPIR